MRIKRLDITGFKSFMERAVFGFDDGITGVVGPNGCGKSNVVDAIRWVMGEQSAKNLRGRGMEDVIFNGSETEPARSMAEVSLTFEVQGTDVLAPQYAGFPEVTVTRRLFRSGESEYLINKTTCRLLDITELFLGTGVGTRAYSIIEQGRVGFIVSAKPEERRAIIEEAAGVTKYKARRKVAERRMEFTQQNLVRVNDLVKELERRLDSLGRQARKAEKYKVLKGQLRELELHNAAHRFLELTAEGQRLEALNATLLDDETRLSDETRNLDNTVLGARVQLEEEARAVALQQEQLHGLEAALSRDAQNIAHWRSDVAAAQARQAEAEAERGALQARAQERQDRIAQVEAELVDLMELVRRDEEEISGRQERQRQVSAAQSEAAAKTEEERGALVALASRVANHETQLANLAREVSDLNGRHGKNRAEAELLREEERRLEGTREAFSSRVDETRQLAGVLAERRGQEQEQLKRARQSFAENEVQVISAREELADQRSRLQSLEEIQRNYEGFDRGVRAVMRHAGERPEEAGVRGLIADVISVEPRFEKAIEGVLGDRLQYVLVDSRERGLQLVEMLRAQSEGRSSFVGVPAGTDAAPLDAEPDFNQPGVIAAAWREARCASELVPLVQQLLQGVVLVEDLNAARAYAANGGAGFTLVTLEGDVLRADGSVTGGILEGPAVGALQKKREVQERTIEVAHAEERYATLIGRHAELQRQVGDIEDALAGLAKHHHAEELNLAHHEKDLHKVGADLMKVRERLESLDAEERELASGLTRAHESEEASRGEVAHGQAERGIRDERLRQLMGEAEALRLEAETLGADLTGLRVRAAAHSERAEAARREKQRLLAEGEEAKVRDERLASQLAAEQERVVQREQEIAQTEVGYEEKRAVRDSQAVTLQAARAEHTERAQGLRDSEALLRERRTALEEVTKSRTECGMGLRESTLQREHLVEGIRERQGVELTEELERFHLAPPLDTAAEEEIRALRLQIEKMGEVNLTAIEEHTEVKSRFDFMQGQQSDLTTSLAQLTEAIRRIDQTSRERFQHTFQIVNEKFEQVFPRLFGGGKAGLVLTEALPGGEPGVEIFAQPPGKKLQAVSLLSGGEKALTAVSLIFAIFLIKPTPFCLLDEVDAPLDEGNVGRYNDMVREMSKRSQFILITHNKRTMECADTLYGVTMEEPGISKLVSVKLKEAVAANDDRAA